MFRIFLSILKLTFLPTPPRTTVSTEQWFLRNVRFPRKSSLSAVQILAGLLPSHSRPVMTYTRQAFLKKFQCAPKKNTSTYFAPSLSQAPQNPHGSSPTTHLRLYSSTFLRFCKFTEKKQTADKQPH